MEPEDGDWRDAQGVTTGPIYKGDGGRARAAASPRPARSQAELWLDKKTREDEDYTDVWS